MRKTPMLIEGKEVELEKETNPAEPKARKGRKEKGEDAEKPLEQSLSTEETVLRRLIMENYVSSLLMYCQKEEKNKIHFISIEPYVSHLLFGPKMSLLVSAMNTREYLKTVGEPKLDFLLENTDLGDNLPAVVDVLDNKSFEKLPAPLRSFGYKRKEELKKLCAYSREFFLIPNFNFLSLAMPGGETFRQYAAFRHWKSDGPLYSSEETAGKKDGFLPEAERFFDVEHLFEFVKKTNLKNLQELIGDYQTLSKELWTPDARYGIPPIALTKKKFYARLQKYNDSYVGGVRKP